MPVGHAEPLVHLDFVKTNKKDLVLSLQFLTCIACWPLKKGLSAFLTKQE